MQDPIMKPPSDSPAVQTVSERSNSNALKHLVNRYPYLSTLAIFAYFLLCFFLLRLIFSPLIARLHLPFLPHTLLGEVLLAVVVAIPIIVLGWWSETGFTRGINGRGVVVCIMPIVLIVLPVLLGLPAIIGRASTSTLVLAALLVLLVGFAEEGLFRGLLLRSLLPRGIWTSVLLSSLLFAGVHLTNVFSGFTWNYVAGQVLIAFGTGVLLAAIRLRTRSIWPGLLLHAAHDFPGILLLAIEPKLALSVSLNLALIVNGVFCALFLINALVLLRPTQLRMLRITYGLAPAPATPPPGAMYPSYQLPAYPGYMGQPPTNGAQPYPQHTPYPPAPSEYIQHPGYASEPPTAWPLPYPPPPATGAQSAPDNAG